MTWDTVIYEEIGHVAQIKKVIAQEDEVTK